MLRKYLHLPPLWTRPSATKGIPDFLDLYSPGIYKKLPKDKGDSALLESALPELAEERQLSSVKRLASLEWLVQQQAIAFDPSISELLETVEEAERSLYRFSKQGGESETALRFEVISSSGWHRKHGESRTAFDWQDHSPGRHQQHHSGWLPSNRS